MPKKIKQNHDLDKNIFDLIEHKLKFYSNLCQKTLIHVEKNKLHGITTVYELNQCVASLTKINDCVLLIKDSVINNCNKDYILSELQLLNNEFASLIRKYGTHELQDLIKICLGENKIHLNDNIDYIKYNLLKNYFHPIQYKVIDNKDKNVVVDDNVNNVDEPNDGIFPLIISDIDNSFDDKYFIKIYGLKIEIYSIILQKTLIVYGYMDNLLLSIMDNSYINTIKIELLENLTQQNKDSVVINNFINSLSIKDYLINKDITDFNNKLIGYEFNYNSIKKKHISHIIKEFVKDTLYNKFVTLVTLLIFTNKPENMYLSYLLYDLLSNDNNGSIDTYEQIILFDNLPWFIKNQFKESMKKTVQYTNQLTNFDMNKIPLEQQICLMNVNDSIKEKAMIKLKEVKAKNEDSGTKARQYLDGLLKIPFSIIRQEPIFDIMNEIKFDLINLYTNYNLDLSIINKTPNLIDIHKNLNMLKNNVNPVINLNKTNEQFKIIKKSDLLILFDIINNIVLESATENVVVNLKHNLNKNQLINKIINMLKKLTITQIDDLITEINKINNVCFKNVICLDSGAENIAGISFIDNKINKLKNYMIDVRSILDSVVHGHEKAKKQVERIVGQWINGGTNACSVLGFEGNPGVGKTTLAKGLSKCLKDKDGTTRPFALIAIGGDSNSSSLIGHSYTYVGSTWGQIVQILMDNQCMNPIILIDEVDKISKTEHGKEIIGVLTHLLDPSQNKQFQDKYFSGIEIDLSNVLFILSYNDPSSIDRVMLDRVTRIKFDSLTIDDKIVITKKHLLPELYDKMRLCNLIEFSDNAIEYIIKEFTLEPGVRKLKEKLFDIVGELNLKIINGEMNHLESSITITKDDVQKVYFKDIKQIKIPKIHSCGEIGLINALWANEYSQGGILPLQVSFVPSNKFLGLTLTGSLGDVMKESINVSLTVAWNLTPYTIQQELIKKYNNPKDNSVYGLHIHCPTISIKKDGPSATGAFTIILYSLFNQVKIKNYFGITGESSFDYKLTEIGGLQEKIIHSIPSGIKEFIYPRDNQFDFEKILDKYKDKDIMKNIKFHAVDTIQDALKLILE